MKVNEYIVILNIVKLTPKSKHVSPGPTTSKEPVTEKLCQEELVWDLYKACEGAKGKGEVKIELQHPAFDVPLEYKTAYLKKLKNQGVIIDYRIEAEDECWPIDFDEASEPAVDLLPYASQEDKKKVPTKHYSDECCQSYDVAFVKCNPQSTMKSLRDHFKVIDNKRNIIDKRNEAEKLFQREQFLRCGKVRFGLETGNIIYDETLSNVMPGGQEYKILKTLMERPNKNIDYQTLCGVAFGNKRTWKTGLSNTIIKREISFIIKNLKRKLEIVRPQKNKDIFRCRGGCMIICD